MPEPVTIMAGITVFGSTYGFITGVSGVSFKKFISVAVLSKIVTVFAYSQSLELTNLIKF